MSCSAVYCSSRTTKNGVKNSELSFHTFPKCPDLRQEWIKALRRENWEPTKYSRLCSKHFEETCFINGLAYRKLKSDAVPTIMEGYPKYYQPVIKKRKAPLQRNQLQGISSINQSRMIDNSSNINDNPMSSFEVEEIQKSLARSQKVALKRLKTIKKLRERNRRLSNKYRSSTSLTCSWAEVNKKRHIKKGPDE